MARKQKTSFFVRSYDKVILIVALVLFLGSLVFLLNGRTEAEKEVEKFGRSLKRLQPEFRELSVRNEDRFNATAGAFDTPYECSGKGHFLVPPERVTCVKCARPIEITQDDCPYCNEKQPSETVSEDWDSDGDGMPDAWEKQYGLNPLDPADAEGDADHDGFTNVEEFRAKTDPSRRESHPPRYDFLRVSKISVMPFPYFYSSKSLLPGGTYKFAIRGGSQDFWIRKGEELSNTGFVLDAYQVTTSEVMSSVGKKKIESYTLILKKGDDTVLIRDNNQPAESSVFEVTFVCTKDKDGTSYTVKRQESFDFDGISFKLESIDRRAKTAVLLNTATGEKLTVPQE